MSEAADRSAAYPSALIVLLQALVFLPFPQSFWTDLALVGPLSGGPPPFGRMCWYALTSASCPRAFTTTPSAAGALSSLTPPALDFGPGLVDDSQSLLRFLHFDGCVLEVVELLVIDF